MKKRIEQEVNKTLESMGDDFEIQVSPMFGLELNKRLAKIRISRGAGYQSKVFYPVVIVFLVILNLTVGLLSLRERQPVNEASDSQVSILASEYGIGQSQYTGF